MWFVARWLCHPLGGMKYEQGKAELGKVRTGGFLLTMISNYTLETQKILSVNKGRKGPFIYYVMQVGGRGGGVRQSMTYYDREGGSKKS